jgi:hypothetical protein
MSYKPSNIIIPKDEDQNNINEDIIQDSLYDSNQIKEKNVSEEIFSIKNEQQSNNINNIQMLESNNNINNIQISDNSQKNKEEECLFKREDINKPMTKYSKEEIIHYIHLIFLNYSSYFPKKQQYLMTNENLMKCIKNCKIIPNKIKSYELDILVKKVCSKSTLITYDDFMTILIKVAQKIFPKEYQKDKSQATNFFFHNIFLVYNDIIFDNSIPLKDLLKYQYSSLVNLINIIPDDSQILILNSLLYTLNEIYEKYFIYNMVCFPNKSYCIYDNGNLNCLFNFCRDFEILPFIFSETQVVTYYNLVVDNKELFKFIDDTEENKDNKENNNNGDTNLFTFNNFILFFVHLSTFYYTKVYEGILDKEKKENELSKLIILLTKLECTKGMRNLIENSLPNLSLIPNKELFSKYNYEYLPDRGLKDDLSNNISEELTINHTNNGK